MSRIAELNQILSMHPELRITYQPSKVSPETVYLSATLVGVKGDNKFSVHQGDVLGAPVWGFGEDLDAILAKAPKRFRCGNYTFRKAYDKTKVVAGIEIREIGYDQRQLPLPFYLRPFYKIH